MKLLLLFGDGAVGKMTVGQELMKISELRLFHNHMTIELVLDVFGYVDWPLVHRLRDAFFEEYAASDNYGMIFTFMWAFDKPVDWEILERIVNIFRVHDADIYYAELYAPQDIRLQRNATENRLKHKPSKRDINASTQRLLMMDENNRYTSLDGELPFENYIKIDNSELTAAETAQIIKSRFEL